MILPGTLQEIIITSNSRLMDFNINRMLKQLMDFNIKQNVVFIANPTGLRNLQRPGGNFNGQPLPNDENIYLSKFLLKSILSELSR